MVSQKTRFRVSLGIALRCSCAIPRKPFCPRSNFSNPKAYQALMLQKMLSKHPSAFRRSMRNNIIPSFEFFNNLLKSKEKTIAAIKRNGRILLLNHKTYTIPNIEVLQEVGLPQKHIASLLSLHPAVFLCSSTKLKEVVESVKKMGFNPLKGTFAIAVYVMRSMRKSTWEKKLEVFTKWGWSEEQTIAAFRRLPGIMLASEDKIMRHMDYLVNKMGQDSSCIQGNPTVIVLSLEKRIIPRCAVHEFLLLKGLIKRKKYNLLAMVVCTEERFLQFLNSHEAEAPRLLKLYKEKLALAK